MRITVPCALGLVLVTVVLARPEDPRPSRAKADGYELVWSDEFDEDGPFDRTKWTWEKGLVRNQEAQWYQAENATCRDGSLVIEARRETRPNPRYEEGSRDWKRAREKIEVTSSSLTTRGKQSWRYGRFEMRAKIPTAPGCWPAFWTLGVEGEWPSNGEIDIMEYFRGTLLANVAWGTSTRWRPRWDSVKKPIAKFEDPAWAARFHVWRMDWDEKSIKLYVDDDLLNETDLTKTVNAGDGRNPFRQPHYILVNLAIGGTAGGDPSRTRFPVRYVVDYVRVYEKKD